MVTEHCENGRFFQRKPGVFNLAHPGHCQLPPQVGEKLDPAHHVVGRWPDVLNVDWCDEWQPLDALVH